MIQRFFAGEYPKKTCVHNKKAPSPRQYGQRNGARARNGNFFSRHIYYNTEPQEKQVIQQKSYIAFERFYHFQFFFHRLQAKMTKEEAAPSPAMGKGCGLGVGDETDTTLIIPYRREEANFFRKI